MSDDGDFKMQQENKLNTRQLGLIDDLFAGELDEQALLTKHRISRITYGRWLADAEFEAELNRRIDTARLLGKILIAKYSLAAAAKLVQLTDSEKEETARKACLDIISLPNPAGQKSIECDEVAEEVISDETAERLLAALAAEENQEEENRDKQT